MYVRVWPYGADGTLPYKLLGISVDPQTIDRGNVIAALSGNLIAEPRSRLDLPCGDSYARAGQRPEKKMRPELRSSLISPPPGHSTSCKAQAELDCSARHT